MRCRMEFGILQRRVKLTSCCCLFVLFPGDSMIEHNGMPWSTYDNDNDNAEGNCAVIYHGAWWYNDCQTSNLNGPYRSYRNLGINEKGITWESWTGTDESLGDVDMKIRPLRAGKHKIFFLSLTFSSFFFSTLKNIYLLGFCVLFAPHQLFRNPRIAGTISRMGKDQTVSTPSMSKARQWELMCTVIWTVNLVSAEDGRYVSQKTLINIIKQYYSCQRISPFFETKVLYLMSRVCCEAKCTT